MKQAIYGPKISKYKEIQPVEMDKGVFFHEMMMKEMGPKTIIVGLATFQPGASLPLHIHNVEESVTVLRGKGCCIVDGVTTGVEPYDTSFIPADIPHRFMNTSDSEEMMILWAYAQVTEELKPVLVERTVVEETL